MTTASTATPFVAATEENGKEREAAEAASSNLYEDEMGEEVEPASWYSGDRDISYFQQASPQSRFDEMSAHHSMSNMAAAVAAHESMASALLQTAMETVEMSSSSTPFGEAEEIDDSLC